METRNSIGAPGGDDLSSPASLLRRWNFAISRHYQRLLDKTVPHILYRWIACLGISLIYAVRVYFIQGFYFITYVLALYLLLLFICFISPLVDSEKIHDTPILPTRVSDEFRPFVRLLPEFKLWYSFTKAFCIALFMTFFSAFDVPAVWRFLVFCWLMMFVFMMGDRIMNMMKYKYVPFSFGKQRYDGKKVPSSPDSVNLPKD